MDGSLLRTDDTGQLSADQGVALDHLRLGWRPVVARDRRVLGVRIEIRAPNTAEASLTSTVGAVIAALADQTTSRPRGIVVLAPTPLSLTTDLQTIGEWSRKANVMLEIGAEALTTRQLPLIEAAHQSGLKFVLRKSAHPLPRDTQRLFAAVVDAESGQSHDGEPALWVRTCTRARCRIRIGARRPGDHRLAARRTDGRTVCRSWSRPGARCSTSCG